MTSVPFPSFVNDVPVSDGRLGMSAVGRCRICPKDNLEEIVAKNVEQALIDTDLEDKDKKDEAKKLKKKYMKEGVAMAKKLLNETLKLDPSVVDIEIVISAEAILTSDGCVAACFLDAGCDKVCIPSVKNALEVAKVPRERLVALLPNDSTQEQILAAAEWSGVISMPATEDLTLDSVVALLHSTGLETQEEKDFQVVISIPSSDTIPELIGSISKHCKDGHGGFCLEDPSPEQLGMSYAACMRTDRPDGLYTTVVCTRSGEALGLVYSSKESVVAALACARGVYYSRSRKGLWRKGDTSGHYQILHRLDVDCDGDALRFTVTQRGDADEAAFCHLHTLTCWGPPRGVRHLEGTLSQRLKNAPEGSYTKRLFDDEALLRDKLVEEAQELSEATEKSDVAGELADVIYFAMVRAVKAGVSIDDAVAELDLRTRKVTRRKGDSKAFRIQAGNEILNKNKDSDM